MGSFPRRQLGLCRFLFLAIALQAILASSCSTAENEAPNTPPLDGSPGDTTSEAVTDGAPEGDRGGDSKGSERALPVQALPHWDGVPVTCGGLECTGEIFARDVYAPPPCCPLGKDVAQCGRAPGYTEGSAYCAPMEQAGIPVADSVCPRVHEDVVTQNLQLEWQGCCRPDNKCATWDLTHGLGCTINDVALAGRESPRCDYAAVAIDAGIALETATDASLRDAPRADSSRD